MVNVRLYLDTRRPKKDGSCVIKIGLAQDGKNYFISTGVSCFEKNWQEEKVGRGEVGYQAKKCKDAQFNKCN